MKIIRQKGFLLTVLAASCVMLIMGCTDDKKGTAGGAYLDLSVTGAPSADLNGEWNLTSTYVNMSCNGADVASLEAFPMAYGANTFTGKYKITATESSCEIERLTPAVTGIIYGSGAQPQRSTMSGSQTDGKITCSAGGNVVTARWEHEMPPFQNCSMKIGGELRLVMSEDRQSIAGETAGWYDMSEGCLEILTQYSHCELRYNISGTRAAGVTGGAVCGNGVCEEGEDGASCAADCGGAPLPPLPVPIELPSGSLAGEWEFVTSTTRLSNNCESGYAPMTLLGIYRIGVNTELLPSVDRSNCSLEETEGASRLTGFHPHLSGAQPRCWAGGKRIVLQDISRRLNGIEIPNVIGIYPESVGGEYDRCESISNITLSLTLSDDNTQLTGDAGQNARFDGNCPDITTSGCNAGSEYTFVASRAGAPPPACGNGTCDAAGGETTATCPADCPDGGGEPPAVTSICADPNLTAAIRNKLGMGSDGAVTEQKMRELTGALSAPNSEIANIDCLKFATNLVELNLSGNRIVDLSPLREYPIALKRINLARNAILDISPLKTLYERGGLRPTVVGGTDNKLDLSGNIISSTVANRDAVGFLGDKLGARFIPPTIISLPAVPPPDVRPRL